VKRTVKGLRTPHRSLVKAPFLRGSCSASHVPGAEIGTAKLLRGLLNMSYRRLLLTAAATSLMLAACNQQSAAPVTGAPIASLPLAEAAPPPEVNAPSADELPPAPPITRVSAPRRAVYSYIDDAYDLGDTFADSPPDYTVAYEGEQPWVWRSSGGDYRVVEQTPYGEREYFYHAGSDYPFLVRDHDYSYAYDGGALVEVYDSYGRPYPNYGPSLVDIAARYLFRAHRLHDAAIHEQRQGAYAADWRAHRDDVLAAQQRWGAQQQSNPDWRRFHDQHVQVQQPQQASSFQQERTQRQAYAQRAAPLIAAAPPAPPPRGGPPLGQRPEFAQDRAGAQPGAASARDQQQAQADAANQARGQAQRQQQAQAVAQAQGQARDQQRAQADAANQARGQAQRQQQAQAAAQAQGQARDQLRAQADAANQARGQAQRQQQAQAAAQAQSQARDQQRAQAAAQGQAQRQQQAQIQQQQAQVQAQQRQAQAQAAAQQHQAAAQQAQASSQHAQAAAQQAQAAAQHAAQASAKADKKPDDQKK
jgi:hypothetical protein